MDWRNEQRFCGIVEAFTARSVSGQCFAGVKMDIEQIADGS